MIIRRMGKADPLPINRSHNWRFDIGDWMKNLKSQTFQDATGTMVGTLRSPKPLSIDQI